MTTTRKTSRPHDSRFRLDSVAKNKTLRNHDQLVSALGRYESREVSEARCLGLADQMLDQSEDRLEIRDAGKKKDYQSIETNPQQPVKRAGVDIFPYATGFPAHPSDVAASPMTKSKNRQQARFLLHYRQG